jgi:hypothetical protein
MINENIIQQKECLEAIQMFINRRMDKQIVIHSFNGILSAIKRTINIYNATGESQKYDAEWKRQAQKCTHCIITFI